MQGPVQIAFHGVEPDPRLEAMIRARVSKLERFHGGLTSCRVVVEQPHRSRETHPSWEVRIDLRVPPSHELVVRERSRETQAKGDAVGAVLAAFESARRQLKRLKERQRGDVKSHAEQHEAEALVRRLAEDHGFVETLDGRELYFHRNSVQGDRFDELRVGSSVAVSEELGREGPQASTLRVVESHPKP